MADLTELQMSSTEIAEPVLRTTSQKFSQSGLHGRVAKKRAFLSKLYITWHLKDSRSMKGNRFSGLMGLGLFG